MQKTDTELQANLDTYGPLSIGSDVWATLWEALWAARHYRYTPNIVVRGNAHLLGTFIPAERTARLMSLVR